MKIIAIWERPQANERYGGIFCLLDDKRLLHVSQEKEFNGTDKSGNRVYIETGDMETGNAFNEEDRFDFEKADYFMRHFGGKVVYHQNK